ncbi:hypothetical protein FYJ38_24445 [Clostridium sp. WB02_MRS01]|uniref:hypothetical protein n=1 Tax=Clostridium sp. WB02_MRS01 TaxID=2605777 RepID=UPI0012B1C5DE|nr:hypothetical protein [Clostridium sp. WB02_MRS01]MSS11760.1 hypothetical protein [Clostridium sp. WB02_MRS01]
MVRNKPVYNYDLRQCNQLCKIGIFPIGIGTNDNTGNVFHVYAANRKYFDALELIKIKSSEMSKNTEEYVTG